MDSAVGHGSVFWIDLRLADGATAAAAGVIPAPESVHGLTCDVLYIEDNAQNVAVIDAFLASCPKVRLRTSPSGDAGLALARERRPDIVLLDIQLPDMDGCQVLQALRSDAHLRTCATWP